MVFRWNTLDLTRCQFLGKRSRKFCGHLGGRKLFRRGLCFVFSLPIAKNRKGLTIINNESTSERRESVGQFAAVLIRVPGWECPRWKGWIGKFAICFAFFPLGFPAVLITPVLRNSSIVFHSLGKGFLLRIPSDTFPSNEQKRIVQNTNTQTLIGASSIDLVRSLRTVGRA